MRILAPVKNASHQDTSRHRAVVDHVAFEREAANAFGKLLSHPAKQRLLRKMRELRLQGINISPRLRSAPARDRVVDDGLKVGPRGFGEIEARQACLLETLAQSFKCRSSFHNPA